MAATKTVSASVSTAMADRTPSAKKPAAATTPTSTGARKFRRRLSSEARRQAINGPTPMRKMSARKSGTLTWLKNGAPTETFTPRATSERSGKTVPKKTVKVTATSSTLLRRKADSRDTIESSAPCAWSASQRHARRPRPVSSTSARKLKKKAPIAPCVKACTDAITPERVRNVPKRVRPKVRITRERFQSLSIRRRSWIITECRNAVAVSHGMNAAFSTGSHAQ